MQSKNPLHETLGTAGSTSLPCKLSPTSLTLRFRVLPCLVIVSSSFGGTTKKVFLQKIQRESSFSLKSLQFQVIAKETF